jgi:hypothetical protein
MQNKNNQNETGGPKIENHMVNCNVFMGDSYGGVFPLPGAQVTVNQYLDPRKMKNGSGQNIDGKVETEDDREKRKKDVMRAITSRFRFEDYMLCTDRQQKKITNDRLASLFRNCFGMSYTRPCQDYRDIQEQLWVLLIDERNQCSKENGEGFFRQTVLNVVGYFMHNNLLNGMSMEVAQCIFPDIDQNKVKNLKRAIPESFPEGTTEMLDYYIEKLHNGEF